MYTTTSTPLSKWRHWRRQTLCVTGAETRQALLHGLRLLVLRDERVDLRGVIVDERDHELSALLHPATRATWPLVFALVLALAFVGAVTILTAIAYYTTITF